MHDTEAVADEPIFDFDDSYARELTGLFAPWQPAEVPAPRLVAFNRSLATELGVEPARLESDDGVALLAGNLVPPGANPIAMAYSGHQFGGYSPLLGDGRALLLGEVVDAAGVRRDIHLKGSGRTPFARGGDGKAVLGPMLREFLVAEAMHALGLPTTRALAVVATGEAVQRDKSEPGAVLTRVAASHLRVGTFEYAARHEDVAVIGGLADYAIARHHPSLLEAPDRYMALLGAVIEAQAALVAQWMLVGFIHGVMNTDNMTISGEGIDYGPCAFMDRFDPATVYSSIDHAGRYAYRNQPAIAQWNLTRFAETLLRLVDADDVEQTIARATETLEGFDDRYRHHWLSGMRAKLGLVGDDPGDGALADDLLDLLAEQRADYTNAFRSLARHLRGDAGALATVLRDPLALVDWVEQWQARLAVDGRDREVVADAMDAANPIYVPRNHLLEAALAAAHEGDLGPFGELLDAVTHPFDERAGLERFAAPAPDGFDESYRTFCGT